MRRGADDSKRWNVNSDETRMSNGRLRLAVNQRLGGSLRNIRAETKKMVFAHGMSTKTLTLNLTVEMQTKFMIPPYNFNLQIALDPTNSLAPCLPHFFLHSLAWLQHL